MTEPKYSNNPFEGYTHRFVVSLYYKKNGEEKTTSRTLHVYSDSGSKEKLVERLVGNEEKRNKVLSSSFSYYNVDAIYSKEEDEETHDFLTEYLNKI